MNLFSKINSKADFEDKIKHSVCPSLDYPFAIEKYKKTDSRYKLVNAFERLIFDSKGIEIFNCKIAIPKPTDDFYNVYIYLKDIKKELGEDDTPLFNQNESFIELFNQVLLMYPIKELKDRKLNRNGIFIQDFNTCAKAFAISSSFHALKAAVKQQYPQIEYLTYCDTIIYVFFPENVNFDAFLDKENIKNFKQFSYKIIEQYDIEQVWTADTLSFMLDDFAIYKSIGGQHYFNSNAMSSGVYI